LPDSAREYARRAVPDGQPTLVVSPCSSHALRNWSPEGYAAVADHAVSKHGLRVLICGGRSALEQEYGARIAGLMRQPCVNLVGQDTLLEMLATLQRSTVLLSPDSGPAHMATTVGTGRRPLRRDESGPQRTLLQPRVVRRPAARRPRNSSWASPPRPSLDDQDQAAGTMGSSRPHDGPAPRRLLAAGAPRTPAA
jgi:hypothetical protein